MGGLKGINRYMEFRKRYGLRKFSKFWKFRRERFGMIRKGFFKEGMSYSFIG